MSLDPSLVSLCLVTMGDVDLAPIILNAPPEFDVRVWNNRVRTPLVGGDYKVFGRYMLIAEATQPVIAFIDDDCWLSAAQWQTLLDAYEPGVVTGNLIREDPLWRSRYHDTTLLGWGAVFDRDLPQRAFDVYERYYPTDWEFMTSPGGAEVVFPMLSKTKTVLAGATWLGDPGQEVFSRSNRMSNQPGFLDTRLRWLERAREVRDRATADGLL